MKLIHDGTYEIEKDGKKETVKHPERTKIGAHALGVVVDVTDPKEIAALRRHGFKDVPQTATLDVEKPSPRKGGE